MTRILRGVHTEQSECAQNDPDEIGVVLLEQGSYQGEGDKGLPAAQGFGRRGIGLKYYKEA